MTSLVLPNFKKKANPILFLPKFVKKKRISTEIAEESNILFKFQNDASLDDALKQIREINSQREYKLALQPLTKYNENLTSEEFERQLSIYENNQSYYFWSFESNNCSSEELTKNLTFLEDWFVRIDEPKPINKDDIELWREREIHKYETGISKYCNLKLVQYVTPRYF